jgi:hypothetical protein
MEVMAVTIGWLHADGTELVASPDAGGEEGNDAAKHLPSDAYWIPLIADIAGFGSATATMFFV